MTDTYRLAPHAEIEIRKELRGLEINDLNVNQILSWMSQQLESRLSESSQILRMKRAEDFQTDTSFFSIVRNMRSRTKWSFIQMKTDLFLDLNEKMANPIETILEKVSSAMVEFTELQIHHQQGVERAHSLRSHRYPHEYDYGDFGTLGT